MKCFDPVIIKLEKPIWSDIDRNFIQSVPVPCGKCSTCIQRRISEWTFRLEYERLNSANCYFVTLTYDNYNVPINNFGKMTLKKSDVQLFFKMLRHEQNRNPDYAILEKHYYGIDLSKYKIKYFLCGEYGSEKGRPHYHAIIFNASKEAILKHWKYGEVDIQVPNSSQALSYLMKYLFKRLFNSNPKGKTPEFSLMSKGLGEGWAEKNKKWYNKNLDILYTTNETGLIAPLSKFLRKKMIEDKNQKKQIAIVKKSMEDIESKERKELGDSYERIINERKKSIHNKFTKSIKKRKEL